MTFPILPLENMSERHPGLTLPIAETYCEAARVCLDRHHTSPKEFSLKNDDAETITTMQWKVTDGRCRRAWGNKDDATRDGAYACALAATELARGLVAVGRAETLTGADYYIAPPGYDMEDLEDCFRLEVSGTDLDKAEVQKRLQIKIRQAKKGKSSLPAIASIVGFQAQLILIETVT